jgi:hypothetical protein
MASRTLGVKREGKFEISREEVPKLLAHNSILYE